MDHSDGNYWIQSGGIHIMEWIGSLHLADRTYKIQSGSTHTMETLGFTLCKL